MGDEMGSSRRCRDRRSWRYTESFAQVIFCRLVVRLRDELGGEGREGGKDEWRRYDRCCDERLPLHGPPMI